MFRRQKSRTQVRRLSMKSSSLNCSNFSHRTVQLCSISTSTVGEFWRNVLHRQWGSLRHLFSNIEIDNANIRRSQSFGCDCTLWCDDLSPISRSVECRSSKAGDEHGAISSSTLLHSWLRSVNVTRQSTLSRCDRAWTRSTNIRRQKPDGCLWSSTWQICQLRDSYLIYVQVFAF